MVPTSAGPEIGAGPDRQQRNKNKFRRLSKVISSLLARIYLAIPALLLLVAMACGTAAEPAPTQAPGITSPAAGNTPAPTAAVEPTPAPANGAAPAGMLNVGLTEMGIFDAHPRTSSAPRIDPVNLSIGEGLVMINEQLIAEPMLAESWTVSDDFLTWTFNIRQGVQLHKGYGEMTAEDVLYSYREWGEGGLHARGSLIKNFFTNAEITDPYTLVVTTAEPIADVVIYEPLRSLGGSSTWVVSKKQSDEMGAEAASRNTAATGPWEYTQSRTAEFWRFRAVEDHWRKVPHFAELTLWQIPEESARLAGFQTGHLDTFDMAFDSIPLVESVRGSSFVSVPGAGQAGLNFYGQVYTAATDPSLSAGWAPDLAYVSSNPDIDSVEWQNAVKVRKALSIAIDRQTIVDTLLQGHGEAIAVRDWAGHQHRAPAHWRWDYDPDQARQLLTEAGYPNGFRIDLVTSIRNAPSEVEACEAIATMWTNVGVDVRFQRIPYETLRPSIVARTWHGATCHNVTVRLAPSIGISNYVGASVFSYGTEHPWLEERVPAALAEVDPERRGELEVELFDFMFTNALGTIGLYSYNSVWPVGPKIREWQPVSYGDVRAPGGYENIQAR
jgi:ABC-type transport system substrate-binding protein